MKPGQDRGRIDPSAFQSAYDKLNPSQRLAVDTIEGPVMVIAGPGTGKTQILTLRIANILLKTDMQPSNILALTFTDSGAKAMRERLRTYIGVVAYQVPIYTFHGFAAKLIGDYPDAYARVIGGRPISDIEKIKLFETILQSNEIKSLRPMGNPTYYITHIQRILSELKQEYVTPDGLAEIISRQENELTLIEQYHSKGAHKGKVRADYTKKAEKIAKNRELLYIYRRYEALLIEQKLFDFDDMIVETVKALEGNEDMLRDLQETYQYILADEHQDVNGSQNKILELLASFHDHPNIFAVGDEKQAIYRFQGASLENFLYFTEQFPGTKVISLIDNYRSGQVILDAAHSLVKVEDGPLKELRIPLVADGTKSALVTLRDFSHQAVEDTWLVEEILAKTKEGVAPHDIAVIVRTNREVETIATLLRKHGLTVTASADGDILRHPITQAVLALINVVTAPKNDAALFTVLHGAYWGIETGDLLKVLSAQSYTRSLWNILSDPLIHAELGLTHGENCTKVVQVIEAARAKELVEAPHRVIEYLLQESSLLDHILSSDPLEGTRVVRRLYDEIEAMVSRDGVSTMREVQSAFATRAEYGLPLNAPYIVTNTEAVQVMTAHKSKGLEFTVVFVPHLTDNTWSGVGKKRYFNIPLQRRSSEEMSDFIEDERRLLYVALTRAKQVLALSSSATSSEGKPLIAARLVSDINEATFTCVPTLANEESFDPVAALKLPLSAHQVDPRMLCRLLAERGLSATALNNYLRSPWDYFYRNVLRIPETEALPLQFGTAIHSVLEFITRYHAKEGSLPTDMVIKMRLEEALNRLPVNTYEYTRLHDKGLEALLVYRAHLEATLPKAAKAELRLEVYLPTGIAQIPELKLTGCIDRVDIGSDGRAYRFIDYKTGKAKSRNVIEGKTKDADGGYKRQLVFYALLLELTGDERYVCRDGVLSFVEADNKGVIKEEAFTITEEEINALKETIITVTKEIISGDFLSTPCDPLTSHYCDLSKLWQNENDPE